MQHYIRPTYSSNLTIFVSITLALNGRWFFLDYKLLKMIVIFSAFRFVVFLFSISIFSLIFSCIYVFALLLYFSVKDNSKDINFHQPNSRHTRSFYTTQRREKSRKDTFIISSYFVLVKRMNYSKIGRECEVNRGEIERKKQKRREGLFHTSHLYGNYDYTEQQQTKEKFLYFPL